jgi:hypothetical protein
MQHPSYLLRCTPTSPTFIKSLNYFDSSLLQVFRRILGLGSFDNLVGPLARKQASFQITFGGIELILIATIAPIAYLESWALVGSIIVVRFMGDQCPFLFEALTQVNNNTFLFQQHFNVACDLLPPPTRTCVPSFE